MSHWRRSGIENCLFLDDGFSCAHEYEKALTDSIHIRKDLMRAGIVWSVKKSVWTPTQSLEWIGFLWDSSEGTLKVKERRVKKLKEFALTLSNSQRCTARKLAGFVGQLISMMTVLGDICRLKSRNAQIWIALAESWDTRVVLRESIKSELRFWLGNIDRLNVLNCFPSSEPVCIDLIEGDASSTGCGSFLNNEKIVARTFAEEKREESSTWRELANIHFTLHAFLPQIRDRGVKFHTDSQSAAKITKIGSMKQKLQMMAEDIFELCFKNSINLSVEWIPRAENEKADAVSRIADAIDVDDWGITESFYKLLNGKWGPISVDLFANYYNKKCDRFYSLFYSPKATGVDAFLHSWAGETCLMVPPISLVTKALYHAKLCKCSVVLVVPVWTSAPFWPVLKNHFISYIWDFMVVKGAKVLEQGLNKNLIFGSNSFQGDVLAVKLVF